MDIDDIVQIVVEQLEGGVDADLEDVFEVLAENGVDLTQYSEDEIREIIDSALEESDESYNVAFGARPDWEVNGRNLAKSTLLDKLRLHSIYPSTIETDKYYGGLTTYAEDKVLEAINKARDSKDITDSVFKELLSLLKKASH